MTQLFNSDNRYPIQHLPVPALIYDSNNGVVQANSQAQQLLALAHAVFAYENCFKHIQLHDFTGYKRIDHVHFFTAPANQLPRYINVPLKSYFQTAKLSYSKPEPHLTLVICQVQVDHMQSKSTEFDQLMSNISAQLIDIQLDDLDNQIENALCAIGTFCNADRSYLFQFSQDTQVMSNTHEWVKKGIPAFKDQLQEVPRNSLPYFFNIMTEHALFNIPDVTQLPVHAIEENTEFTKQNIKSILCIGLIIDHKLFGFIGCDCVVQARQWSTTDLIRIKLVGDVITNALKNVFYKKHIEQMQNKLIDANKELKNLAHLDGLTNIPNRREFDQRFQSEILRSARAQLPLSLVMCDIDHFKLYNDNYGHQQGDEILRLVASALNRLTNRQGEIVCRYGGEEFAIILPLTDKVACQRFANLIQQTIQNLNITHPKSATAKTLTLSIGHYSCIPDKDTKADALIQCADRALLHAKSTGRNKINSFTSPP